MTQGKSSAKPYGAVLSDWAQEKGDELAIICAYEERTDQLSWQALELQANRLARAYESFGLKQGDFATVALPNGTEFFTACLAIWKVGATPNPVSHRLPEKERAVLIEKASPVLVIGIEGEESEGRTYIPSGFLADAFSDDPLPDHVPLAERAMASGGSTGEPKLIIAKQPALYDAAQASPLFKAKRAVLIPGPLYHAAPFSAAWQALLGGAKIIVMPRFDAASALALIERYCIDRMTMVPTMMQRIWRLPSDQREAYDLSSLDFVMTGGAPCPQWLMKGWIDWLGADVMHEAYGPSERTGGTFITGKEWLAHPGSVGRPSGGAQIRILNDHREELPPGEMGEIYMLPPGGQGSTYRYVGAEPRAAKGGWESVGDMGYLDEEGYLYLGDRRSDMILSGGRNIYPAEVEAALDSFPLVRSSAVIGLPDDDLGQRLHAIVDVGEAKDRVTVEALQTHLSTQLVHYKIPKTFEFVDYLLRDDAGKVRRSALRQARLSSAS